MRLFATFAAVAMCCFSIPVHAQQTLQVTIENLQPSDGFYATPVWFGFHDGSFDYFDAGSLASMSVQDLAEEGMVGGLMSDFAGNGDQGVVAGPNGFGSMAGQPPVIDPGEVSSVFITVDPNNQFFSFGTMVIPSNDAFFGNDNPLAYQIFDSNGTFILNSPIQVALSEAWDAGSEENDGQGAAFSAVGGISTDESNPIALHAGLGNFDGTGTAAGTIINFANASSSSGLLITISTVPEPCGLTFAAGLGCLGLMRRRKRNI